LRAAVVISEKLAVETLDNLGTMRKGNFSLEKLLKPGKFREPRARETSVVKSC
jgi:hypothetical protein